MAVSDRNRSLVANQRPEVAPPTKTRPLVASFYAGDRWSRLCGRLLHFEQPREQNTIYPSTKPHLAIHNHHGNALVVGGEQIRPRIDVDEHWFDSILAQNVHRSVTQVTTVTSVKLKLHGNLALRDHPSKEGSLVGLNGTTGRLSSS